MVVLIQFRVELTNQGAVGRIVPTEEGNGYGPNTTLRLYESDTKLFAHGENIGKLATLEIISSGKDFNMVQLYFLRSILQL